MKMTRRKERSIPACIEEINFVSNKEEKACKSPCTLLIPYSWTYRTKRIKVKRIHQNRIASRGERRKERIDDDECVFVPNLFHELTLSSNICKRILCSFKSQSNEVQAASIKTRIEVVISIEGTEDDTGSERDRAEDWSDRVDGGEIEEDETDEDDGSEELVWSIDREEISLERPETFNFAVHASAK